MVFAIIPDQLAGDNMNIFITGTSSGLGEAFANYFSATDANLYGLGRTALPKAGYQYVQADIADFTALQTTLHALFDGIKTVDLVVLNAGVLGRIQDISNCEMKQLKFEMDVNMWANKVILDFFIRNTIALKQVIAVSSGASVNGSLGWNGYSLSKAALNMLIKLYAAEMKNTHLCALAPGLVKTKMLNGILYGDHDTTRYTSVQRLRESEAAGMVFPPDETVLQIMKVMPKILEQESGSFVDIRDL
jgi:benzil reductase ((S)-benzoin forming)